MFMEVRDIADKILKVSPSVRIVSVCSLQGKLLFSAHRKSVKNKLTAAESRQSLANAFKAWKTRKKLSHKLGKCRYVIADYERVRRITMPAGKSHFLYVTTSTSLDPMKVISRVRKLR